MIPGNDFEVFEGVVFHARSRPKKHRFQYKVFNFLIDLDALDEVAARHQFFSRNRFNLFSFRDRDHCVGEHDNIADYLRDALCEAGLARADKIYALFYPRILGYAFNPLIVFYCYDGDGAMFATFYQVNNTFGERHTYLIPATRNQNMVVQGTEKRFHVSPFIDMDMRYTFYTQLPSNDVGIGIDVSDEQGLLLKTSFKGHAVKSPVRMMRLFFRYPFMVVKVVGGIHYEALRLMAKGMKLLPSGPRPSAPISMGKIIQPGSQQPAE